MHATVTAPTHRWTLRGQHESRLASVGRAQVAHEHRVISLSTVKTRWFPATRPEASSGVLRHTLLRLVSDSGSSPDKRTARPAATHHRRDRVGGRRPSSTKAEGHEDRRRCMGREVLEVSSVFSVPPHALAQGHSRSPDTDQALSTSPLLRRVPRSRWKADHPRNTPKLAYYSALLRLAHRTCIFRQDLQFNPAVLQFISL